MVQHQPLLGMMMMMMIVLIPPWVHISSPNLCTMTPWVEVVYSEVCWTVVENFSCPVLIQSSGVVVVVVVVQDLETAAMKKVKNHMWHKKRVRKGATWEVDNFGSMSMSLLNISSVTLLLNICVIATIFLIYRIHCRWLSESILIPFILYSLSLQVSYHTSCIYGCPWTLLLKVSLLLYW